MSEWKTYRLSDLADIRTSNVDKIFNPKEISVSLCNYMDVYRNDYITNAIEFMDSSATIAERAKFLVEKGDVLITKDSETPFDIGIPAVVVDDIDSLVCGYHLALIKPLQHLTDPIFLSKQLASESVASHFRRTAAGSTRFGLSVGSISDTKVLIPSLQSQNEVSKILSIVDQTIEKTEALIEKYQQIKAGLMHDLFTRGIGADGKLRPPREEAPELYQETAIGWIPRDWTVDKLGVHLDVIDPNPSHRYPAEVNDGYPICSTENFLGENEFDLGKCKHVPFSIYKQQSLRCSFKSTDVVFARKGRIGMSRRYGTTPKVFSHTVVVIKPHPQSQLVHAEWVLWLTRSAWLLKTIDVTMNSNSGVPTLGVEFIKKIFLPFPKKHEQKLMNKFLTSASLGVDEETKKLKKLVRLKTGLMQDLLTGKVQVNIPTPEQATT